MTNDVTVVTTLLSHQPITLACNLAL